MNAPEETEPILLPTAATRSAATGLTADTTGIPALVPAAGAEDLAEGGDTELANRIESVIAEDGRFRAILTGLTITAANGSVSLGGTVPDGLRASLLATVHALPGVHDVQADFA